MYALIEADGRQYRVEAGENISVEKLDAEPGTEIVLDRVLAIVTDNGARFGNPYIPEASVSAEVVKSDKGRKVLVYKQRPRKGFRKLRGHRQQFTALRVKEIREGN